MTDAATMANRAHAVLRDADGAPAQTATTADGGGLAIVHLRGTVELQRHGDVRPACEPVHTVRAGGHHHGVIMRNNTARGDDGQMSSPIHEPVRTLTTTGGQSLIVPFYSTGNASPAGEKPSPTATSRDRLALVVPAVTGNVPVDADLEPTSTLTQRAKHALVLSEEDIEACGFRMFTLGEIAGAMALSRHTHGGEYVVTGNKRERMAQYGNAVTPPVMALIVSRLLDVIQAQTFTDLFCGAGGSSLGAALVGGELRLGLNHWARAIETHATNFQDADHDCEDVSSLTTGQIRRYPDSDILLASPECTNHSLAKGARRRKPQAASLFSDGPGGDAEQDRSRATMWDVVRFAEQKRLKGRPYKAIVVENVVDAFKWGYDDDGGLFDAWLHAMTALGYRHEIVWLNSMFAHSEHADLVPQSRDRMYVVFRLKTIKPINLRFDVPAWCPHCERLVDGRQTFKRNDQRPWGRYGPQYYYRCTDCDKPAIPGAAPAASIIDDTVPILPIGEQTAKLCKQCGERHPVACNTRRRIKRGLERLLGEPFAIRLTHGGMPKTLTLPIVTLTQRHDLAMVMPAAGNTYETTPGNRARDAATRPLDTIHGTLDRAVVRTGFGGSKGDLTRDPSCEPAPALTTGSDLAMVVPPMGSVDARSADQPAPTQTTTTRAAVVTAGGQS